MEDMQTDGTPTAPAAEATPLAPDATPVAPVAPVAPTAEGTDFHKVIGPDGTFLDGWKDSLPEEIRNETSLDFVNDVPGAIKQLVNAQKMTGRDKVVIPGDDAQPEERDAFEMKLGRPATKDLYELNIPEGFEDRFDPENTKEVAFNFGLSQKKLDGLLAYRSAEIQAEDQAIQERFDTEFARAEEIIMAEAGEALEEQQYRARLMIADNVPDKINLPDGTVITGAEYQEKLLEGLNDSAVRPYVFNLLANIHRKTFGQHGGLPEGSNQQPGALTPQMLEAKADELMETEGYINGSMKENTPEKYKRLTMEIAELYNRMERAKNASVG